MAAAYTITVTGRPQAASVALRAVPTGGGQGMDFVLTYQQAVWLAAWLLSSVTPTNAPVTATSGTGVYVAPPSPPAPPPTPPQPVPVDPAFAAMEAARANKEANRLPVTPLTPPPATGGTSTFGG